GPGGGNARSLTPQAQAITSTQGIPLFDRKFSFEQGLTYTHYDKRSLVLRGFLALDSILLGRINLQQIKTDQLQYDLTGRWSLTERISVDLNVPLIYRTSQYFSPGAGNSASAVSDEQNSSKALGDASAGIYYQLPKAAPSDLDWVASFRVKSPSGKHPFGIKLRDIGDNDSLLVPTRQATGNGIWSTTLGLSVLKTSDPLVLFFNVAYNYNLPHSFADLSGTLGTVSPGDVKLGNAWSVGAGFALALNDKTSVSFSYAQVVQQAARLRGQGGPWTRQVGSDANSVTFNTGLTHQLTPKWTMVGTVSVGLTPDAPNVSLGIKFPYAF
ncbi:transporter, partial [Janthinobacterium sp.]|uniref:transporter n=1 Tax=Janthinobacterium sp. TaxID=1871054 RepID=UPI00293D8168